jgi:bla regulator protein blaR1
MKAIEILFSPEMVEALGWTIVHSLWQGFLVLTGLSLILLFLRKHSAQLNYFISFIALIGILGWSSVTFVQSFQYAREKQLLKEKIVASPGYLKTFLEKSISKEKGESVVHESFNLKELKVRAFFQRNFYIICSFWLIGIIFLVVRFTGGLLYTQKLRRFNVLPLPDEWVQKIEELTLKLNIRRKVNAFFSPLAKIPITLGVLKPVILFPVSAFTGLSIREIEAIIAHELAHVLRNDYFFNIIQSMVEIVFFFHPAVWVISAKIRKERENSCDNIAVQATGDKVAFVKALASVQIQYWESQQLAMGFAGKRDNILHRIKRLQNNIVMKTNFIEGLIAAGVIVIGLALASFTNIENIKAKNMAVVDSNDSTTVIKKSL